MTVRHLASISHTDHGITDAQMAYVIRLLNAEESDSLVKRVGSPGGSFFICEVTLPENLGIVRCALRGPATGEAPVADSDAFMGKRGNRPNLSRLTHLLATTSRIVTVIGGESKEVPGQGCIVFTAYGGPLAPQEPGDPYLKEEDRAASVSFWSLHALSV